MLKNIFCPYTIKAHKTSKFINMLNRMHAMHIIIYTYTLCTLIYIWTFIKDLI